MEQVKRILPPREVAEVLRITLGAGNSEDKLVWSCEKDEIYSVNSAYRLFHAIKKTKNEDECSNSKNQRALWKKLWKLQIPNRVKVFA